MKESKKVLRPLGSVPNCLAPSRGLYFPFGIFVLRVCIYYNVPFLSTVLVSYMCLFGTTTRSERSKNLSSSPQVVPRKQCRAAPARAQLRTRAPQLRQPVQQLRRSCGLSLHAVEMATGAVEPQLRWRFRNCDRSCAVSRRSCGSTTWGNPTTQWGKPS